MVTASIQKTKQLVENTEKKTKNKKVCVCRFHTLTAWVFFMQETFILA